MIKGQYDGGRYRPLFATAILLILLRGSPCLADLDIFDHPKEVERKSRAFNIVDESKLLEYPKECLLRGNYQEALDTCRKLLSGPPVKKLKGEISYLAGLSALKLGRFLEARSYFNDVILIRGEREELKAAAYLGLADAYFTEGGFDKALIAYTQVLTKYPDSPLMAVVNYRMGETLLKMSRPDEAKAYLNKVRNDFPLSFEARLLNDLEGGRGYSFGRTSKFDLYTIQVGCFSERGNAAQMCKKLVKEGFDATILESQGAGGPKFRVKVGKFNSRNEAEAVEARLRQAGYPTKVCP